MGAGPVVVCSIAATGGHQTPAWILPARASTGAEGPGQSCQSTGATAGGAGGWAGTRTAAGEQTPHCCRAAAPPMFRSTPLPLLSTASLQAVWTCRSCHMRAPMLNLEGVDGHRVGWGVG